MITRRLVAEGHLIDTGLMSRMLNVVVENGGEYRILRFDMGRTVDEYSRVEIEAGAPDPERLNLILDNLVAFGARIVEPVEQDALRRSAVADGTAPEEFYSTTNHRTQVRIGGEWIEVAEQRMDAVLRVREGSVTCVKLRDVKSGDAIVCGVEGIRVLPPFKARETMDFVFMDREVSSERRVEIIVAELARAMTAIHARGGRTVVVAGPVVVHTGGAPHLARLIRGGFVQALLAGNALAVHDVELALYGTSLGVDLATGVPVYEGHQNHMRAINAIRTRGSLAEAVESGLLSSGILRECLAAGVPVVLAGSIRDDGPLPETIMDLIEAQDRYAEALAGADLVLILATMLHGIGAGNMLPSWVRTVCVDIHPAVVTKLVDRGSSQAAGVVTDVGLFLRLLADELGERSGPVSLPSPPASSASRS